MRLDYRKSESTTKPEAVDTTSSKTSVYLRKNIVEKERQDDEGNVSQYFEYDEAKLTKSEYEEYLKELEINETLQTVDNLKVENASLSEQVNMLTDCILEMSEMLYA